MSPGEIAIKNMFLVMQMGAAIFVFNWGCDIFGFGRAKMVISILGMAALAAMIFSSLSGFMGAAESISKGVWPK